MCSSNKKEYCMSAVYFYLDILLYLLHFSCLRNAELFVWGCVFNNLLHNWQMKWGLSEKSFGCVMGEHGCALLIDDWKVVQLNIIQFLCSAQCSCSFFFMCNQFRLSVFVFQWMSCCYFPKTVVILCFSPRFRAKSIKMTKRYCPCREWVECLFLWNGVVIVN